MRVLLVVLAIAGLANYDFTVADPPQVVRSPFDPIWTPVITTDCETWTLRQSDAALDDVWPQADYWTVNGTEQPETVTLPADTNEFEFVWWKNDQILYKIIHTVRTIDC